MKKWIKIILFIGLEITIFIYAKDLISYHNTVTKGTFYEKIIYLLYCKNDNWWNRLPMDLEYRYINRDLDLREVKTDEMMIHTLSDPPGVYRTEDKIIAIEWRTEDMGDMVYRTEMNKSGIGKRYLLIYSQEDFPQILYTDSFDYEKMQILESYAGEKEAEIRQYMGKCDINLKEFVENLCRREKFNLLIQIAIYTGIAAAGIMGMIPRQRHSIR